MLSRFAISLGIALFIGQLFGCGKKEPEFGQVKGVVRVNGKPQGRLLVRFMPDPGKGTSLPINASGRTDSQGNYELKFAYQGKEGLGAPVGFHRVLIEDTALSQIPQGQTPPPQLVSPAYNSPATTPLLQEVKPGEQTIDLEIKN